MSMCAGCGLRFRSIGGFEAHRIGSYNVNATRRCLTPAELTERGWSIDDLNRWTMPPPVRPPSNWSRP